MASVPTAAGLPATERQPDPVTAGAAPIGPRSRTVTSAAAVVMGVVVVIAQPEEPNQPHDQQADVENPKADHEDPPLGGHAPMLPRV
jgi:hypothetical protein